MTPHQWKLFKPSNDPFIADKYVCDRCKLIIQMSDDGSLTSSNWIKDCDLAVIKIVMDS